MGQWAIIGGLVGTGAFVILAGARAVRYGDLLAEKTRLSSAWVGLVLLAALTSLPELVVTIAAQLAVSRPGLVMSNVCGSNLFNLLIFGLVDLTVGAAPISFYLDKRLVRPAVNGMFIMSIAIVSMLLPRWLWGRVAVVAGWVSSLAVVSVYFRIMTLKQEGGEAAKIPKAPKTPKWRAKQDALSLGQVIVRFAGFALVLVASGTALILLCDKLLANEIVIGSFSFRVDESVVGMVVLAMITSLPEVAVSLSAVRREQYEMAVGNILGSNIFNVCLLPIAHFVRPTEPFWSAATPVNAASLAMAMLLAGVIAVGIRFKTRRSLFGVGWDGFVVAALGVLTFFFVVRTGMAAS